MTRLRWWFFKKLSWMGWAICPEPHKSRLQTVMPQWSDVDREFALRWGAQEGER